MADVGDNPPSMLDRVEQVLLSAPIEDVLAFHITADPGGGHAMKRTLILEGGITVMAKCAPAGDLNQYAQAQQEVAAWKLLRALGWQHLAAATVLRQFDDPSEGRVSAAVQVVWPEALLTKAPPVSSLDPDDTYRAAAFDFLILNCDRGGHNWFGLQDGRGGLQLKLYDHGHCFGLHGPNVSSEFVTQHAGEPLPPDISDALEALTASSLATVLEHLDESKIEGILSRRSEIVTAGKLPGVVAAA